MSISCLSSNFPSSTSFAYSWSKDSHRGDISYCLEYRFSITIHPSLKPPSQELPLVSGILFSDCPVFLSLVIFLLRFEFLIFGAELGVGVSIGLIEPTDFASEFFVSVCWTCGALAVTIGCVACESAEHPVIMKTANEVSKNSL